MNLLHNKGNSEERLIGLILWKGGERRLLDRTSPRRTSLVRSFACEMSPGAPGMTSQLLPLTKTSDF